MYMIEHEYLHDFYFQMNTQLKLDRTCQCMSNVYLTGDSHYFAQSAHQPFRFICLMSWCQNSCCNLYIHRREFHFPSISCFTSLIKKWYSGMVLQDGSLVIFFPIFHRSDATHLSGNSVTGKHYSSASYNNRCSAVLLFNLVKFLFSPVVKLYFLSIGLIHQFSNWKCFQKHI